MDAISRRNALANAAYFLAIPSTHFRVGSARGRSVNFKAKTLAGETITTESVHGKIVLVQFWATWCPYCRADAPAVDAMLREFKDEGLEVLAVNIGESKRTVTKFLAGNPRDCKIVLLTDTNLAAWFSPHGYPHYVGDRTEWRRVGEQNGAGRRRTFPEAPAASGGQHPLPTVPTRQAS